MGCVIIPVFSKQIEVTYMVNRGMTDLDSKKAFTPDDKEDKTEVAAITCWKLFWKEARLPKYGYSYRIKSLKNGLSFDVVKAIDTPLGEVYSQNSIDYANYEEWIDDVKAIFEDTECEYNKAVYKALIDTKLPPSIADLIMQDYAVNKDKVRQAKLNHPRHKLLPTAKGTSDELIQRVTDKLYDGFGKAGTEILLYHIGHTVVQDYIPHTARTALLVQSEPGTGKSIFFNGLFDTAKILGFHNATIPDRHFGWYDVWSSSFGFKDDITEAGLLATLNHPSFKSGITHGKVFVEEKGNAGFTIEKPQATLTFLINDLPADFARLDSGIKDRLACVTIQKPLQIFTENEYFCLLGLAADLFIELFATHSGDSVRAWLMQRQEVASPEFYNADYKINLCRGTLAYLKSTLTADEYDRVIEKSDNLNFGFLVFAIRSAIKGNGMKELIPLNSSQHTINHLNSHIDQVKAHGRTNTEWRKNIVKDIEFDFGAVAVTLAKYRTAFKLAKKMDITTFEPDDSIDELRVFIKKVGI